jgi:hypothetical protein
MGKAIQCPSCGRKHPVRTIPDAPTFHCEGCGQGLKVPAQFRPSVMASSRHITPPEPAPQSQSTSVLPGAGAAAGAGTPSVAAAARRRAPARPRFRPKADAGSNPVPLPLRLLAWAAALVIGLVVTVWIARITGWLSGDRLVDVFTGTGGVERYLRVLALAPVWALFATGLLTLFLDGGRALARRRAEKRADEGAPAPWPRFRRAPKRVDKSADELGDDRARGDGQRFRRRAAGRRSP